MYERLKEFMKSARANEGLDAWNTDHDKVLQGFEDAMQQLRTYRESHGFTGATGDAMDRWVDASIERIKWYQSNYARGYESYEMGRQVMRYALAEAETISDDLLDAKTAAMRNDWVVSVSDKDPGGGIEFMGRRYTTGAAYVEAVEAQANAQREAAAARILNQMNSRTARMSTGMHIGASPFGPGRPEDIDREWETPDNSSGGRPPIWGGTSGNGYGRNDDRSPSSPNYPDGFNQPWWSEADEAAARNRIMSSGAVPTRELPYGEHGSRTHPITDPQELMGTDLLHKSVNGTTYRNGVLDGHTPAPPADAHHPLWRLNGGGASDATTSGRLGGVGVLGTGALGLRGAARMGSGSFGGSGSLGGSSVFGRFGGAGAGANGLGGSGSASGLSGAGRMGAAGMRGMTGSTNGMGASGAAGLKVGSYSGSGFGSYTPPAGSAGAAGAGGANGAAGSSGVTGTTGANGGAAGAGGAAGKGGTGSGGFMGAGAGAGAGKEDKKGRKRQYVAFKFDDDEDELPAGYVNPMSQTSGTDKEITPAKRTDDGWDPRQW